MHYMFRCTCPRNGAVENGPSLDLPGLEGARMAALRLAIDLRDREGPLHWRGWIIEATDETGTTVLTMSVSPDFPDLALAS
jgi:hypothetical protein